MLALLGVLTFPLRSGSEAQGQVLLLLRQGEQRDLEAFRQALLAHTSGLPVTVRTLSFDSAHEPEPGSIAAALGSGQPQNLLLVVWVSKDRQRLFLWTPQEEGKARERSVPDSGEGLIARFEVMAAMVYSELELLVQEEPDEAVTPPLPEVGEPPGDPAQPSPAGTEALPSSAENAFVEPRTPEPQTAFPEAKRRPKTEVSLGLSAGYAPTLVSFHGPIQHGAELAAFARLRLTLSLDLGLAMDLLEPLSAAKGSTQVDVQRWPVRIFGALWWTMARARLGLRLDLLIDLWRAADAPFEFAHKDVERLHATLGVAPGLLLSLRALPWLEPWMEVGADVFFVQREFYLDTEKALELGRFEPRVLVGLSLFFNLSAEK